MNQSNKATALLIGGLFLLAAVTVCDSSCSFEKTIENVIKPNSLPANRKGKLGKSKCEDECRKTLGCESYIVSDGTGGDCIIAVVDSLASSPRGILLDPKSTFNYYEKICSNSQDDPPSSAFLRCEVKTLSASFAHGSQIGTDSFSRINGLTNVARGSDHCRSICWIRQCVAFATGVYWNAHKYFHNNDNEHCFIYKEAPANVTGGRLALQAFECKDFNGNIVTGLPDIGPSVPRIDPDVIVTAAPPQKTSRRTTRRRTTTATTTTAPATQGFPIVDTDAGKVRGRVEMNGIKKYGVFLGIPYAKPPTSGNDLRFKDPEDPDPWNGIKDTDRDMPKQCVQFGAEEFDDGKQSEDCLYLNVFTPKYRESQNTKYAVIVYIHGGSYTSGSSHEYPMEGILKNIVEREVVFVNFHYRLGPFGFWTAKTDDYAGNYGLADMLKALDWVQDNIERFGGDPDRVTVMGESAGAGAIQLLNRSPESKGKFIRAIIMSAPRDMQYDGPNDVSSLLVETLCPNEKTAEDKRDCMKAKSTEEIVDAAKAVSLQTMGRFTGITWGPRFDGDGVPENIRELDPTAGEVMIGTTKDEYGLWEYTFGLGPTDSEDKVEEAIEKTINRYRGFRNVELVRKALKAKFIEEGKVEAAKLPKFAVPDFWRRQMVKLISLVSFHGNAMQEADSLYESGVNVFLYSFDHIHSHFTKRDPEAGAYHMHDLVFLFLLDWENYLQDPSFSVSNDGDDKDMADIMGITWTNFAKYGLPTKRGKPAGLDWDAYDPDEHNFASLTGKKPEMKIGFHPSTVPLWVHFIGPLAQDSDSDGSCGAAFSTKMWRDSYTVQKRKEMICESMCP